MLLVTNTRLGFLNECFSLALSLAPHESRAFNSRLSQRPSTLPDRHLLTLVTLLKSQPRLPISGGGATKSPTLLGSAASISAASREPCAG